MIEYQFKITARVRFHTWLMRWGDTDVILPIPDYEVALKVLAMAMASDIRSGLEARGADIGMVAVVPIDPPTRTATAEELEAREEAKKWRDAIHK